MILSRRNFVRLGTAGTAGFLAGCQQPAPPAPQAQRQPQAQAAGPLNLHVEIGGGFAMVFTKAGTLALGSMRLPLKSACHALKHQATLLLTKGSLTSDTSKVPSVTGNPGQSFVRKWTVVDVKVSLVEGAGAGRIPPPAAGPLSAGSVEDLGALNANSAWNDWRYVHFPTRHHTGSSLRSDWQDYLSGIVELRGVNLEVRPPSQSCAQQGRWGATPGKPTAAGFKKPLTDRVEAKATSAASRVRFVIADDDAREIVIEPEGDVVQLVVAIEPRSPRFNYVVDNRIEHLAMFYELVTPDIPCNERLVPAFLGYPEGKDCPESPLGALDPGGFCPGMAFTEA